MRRHPRVDFLIYFKSILSRGENPERGQIPNRPILITPGHLSMVLQITTYHTIVGRPKESIMKTVVRYNEEAKYQYEVVEFSDDGKEVVKPIVATDPANESILKLPENASNRKWISVKKLEEAAGFDYELTYKETRTFGPRLLGQTSPRKPLEDYLTEDERKTYDDLMAKARERREEATKKPPMTELEKAKRAYERAQEKFAKLQAEEEARKKAFQEGLQAGDFTKPAFNPTNKSKKK